MSKKLLLFAAVCLILSSCSQKQDVTAVPTGNNTSVEVTAPETVPPTPSDNSSEAVTDSPTEEITEEQEPASQTDEDDAITPLYHINKAYRVVPNEEGTETKVVLLTFDDGPKEQEMIDGLIDTLDKHNAKAIFFVNGYRVKTNPDLLKLIHERGQIIGNHSWDHIDLKKESEIEARKQVEDVQAIVEETIGERPRFFRPPFGSGNDQLHHIVEDNDMIYMTWSNGSLDWDSKNKNKPEAVIQNVLEQLHAGSNILMHELPWTVEALDSLLTQLEEKGYSFVDPRAISGAPEQSE